MKKFPAFQFYPGDWLKDPALSLCSPAARGIWMDLLCAMHENGRTGELTGTVEQLARIARCSPSELQQYISELSAGAASVTKRNGRVTITNRRMAREYKARQDARLRQQQRREKQGLSPLSQDDNAEVTLYSSSSSSSSDKDSTLHTENNEEQKRVGKGQFIAPSFEEVRDYVTAKNLNVDPQKFFDYFTAGNWVDSKGNKVRNWKQKLITWSTHNADRGRTPESNNRQSQSPDGSRGPQASRYGSTVEIG